MKANFRKAYAQLQALGVPLFISEDAPDRFDISAEDADSSSWVNYYEGMYAPDWIFGVHPKVYGILTKHGLFAEWQNPAHLRVYEL